MSNLNGHNFTKMHGIGNDIVIVDCLQEPLTLNSQQIISLADRHTGIGFDQLITIEPSKTSANFFCQIYNPDGSIAEQCGNGLRCVAKYLFDHHLNDSAFAVETIAGIFQVQIHDNTISVSMNEPVVIEKTLALSVPSHGDITLTTVSTGNPHAILCVDNVGETDIETLGKQIASHKHFQNGTNVGFMQVNDTHQITLRTYERGAGRTLACGSNACAAVVAGITNGLLQTPVTVNFERGSLTISWDGNQHLIMTGPADYCFQGKF